jgi:hypothetical protein
MGVLIDHDVSHARKWFGGRVADAVPDREVVEEAWDGENTIVTANGAHFVKHMLAHQRTHTHGLRCHDMSGLVVVPNQEFRAENAIAALRKRRGVRFGNTVITMRDVAMYNLYVKIHANGSTTVKRFPLCQYREDIPPSPPWYDSLPVVGTNDEQDTET